MRGIYASLHAAARVNDVAATKELLKAYKPDPNFEDHFGLTPMHTAVISNAARTAEILLEAGADVEKRFPKNMEWLGCTCLHAALKLKHHAMVKMLLDLRVYCNPGDVWFPEGLMQNPAGNAYARDGFYMATEEKDAEMVRILLDGGLELDPNAGRIAFRDSKPHHIPPLFFAIDNGDVAALKHLIKAGANTLLTTGFNHGLTPFQHAAVYNQHKMVPALMEVGAQVWAVITPTHPDFGGQTPFDVALERGCAKVVEIFLRTAAPGIIPNRPCLSGKYAGLTPLQAVVLACVAKVTEIRSLGVIPPDAPHMYWSKAHRKTARLLHADGADPHAVIPHGKYAGLTPSQVAYNELKWESFEG